jgi:hypothetical protein
LVGDEQAIAQPTPRGCLSCVCVCVCVCVCRTLTLVWWSHCCLVLPSQHGNCGVLRRGKTAQADIHALAYTKQCAVVDMLQELFAAHGQQRLP